MSASPRWLEVIINKVLKRSSWRLEYHSIDVGLTLKNSVRRKLSNSKVVSALSATDGGEV